MLAMPAAHADEAADAGRLACRSGIRRAERRRPASRARMTWSRKGRDPREREMYSLQWTVAGRTLVADPLHQSRRHQGVGLLTKDYPGDETTSGCICRARPRAARVFVAQGWALRRLRTFFEDLRDREVNMDTHIGSSVEQHRLTGVQGARIIPVDPDNSVYTKRISWVHPQTLIPLRVDLYQAHSKSPVKRLSVQRIKKIQGFWTVLESTMEDLESGHVTGYRWTRSSIIRAFPIACSPARRWLTTTPRPRTGRERIGPRSKRTAEMLHSPPPTSRCCRSPSSPQASRGLAVAAAERLDRRSHHRYRW